MRVRTRIATIGLALGLLAILNPASAGAAGSFVLTAHRPASGYAPTFTGNGLLGVRVPPSGQGYAGGTVPAQSELAGFYAKPAVGKASVQVQQRANLPTWSTLTFVDGGQAFSPSVGTLSGWRQTIDLHTGAITTSATWKAPDGHVTDLRYEVFTDRAREHIGVVTLTLTPHWSGPATVTDAIDGTPAIVGPPKNLTTQVGQGWDLSTRRDWVAVQAVGTGLSAVLASQLSVSPNISAASTQTDQNQAESVGQQVSFPVTAGQSYTLTKYVGIEDTQTAADPTAAAQTDATAAAATGYAGLRAENDAAWATMWRGRIDVLGNPLVATDVNASEFYLWSSTRADLNWSISPAGLSSNGYDGHIFWDAETWMYPSLLAQHPELAAAMEAYRFDRLAAAQQHATATGFAGARFPWESALDGTEQIPPPVLINSEGLYEQHITADIALAQWQYFEATGDRQWLDTRGWPVISGAAAFWASRAVRGSDGRYHVRHVTGPDEENPNVSDEAFTNVGAKASLQNAIAAAKVLGKPVPTAWGQIAAGLVVPVSRLAGAQVHPEFSGYGSQLVKQADVTLLQYPWEFAMSPAVGANDLAFYVPRTDPMGPSMSDAVNSIDASALGTPGCASFVYTQRSYEPFIRDVFHQFSETKTGGAFTFMTGIGGFLQEFLYGYSGLRWRSGEIRIAPSLSGQMSGVVLHDLAWRGRRFTVAVGHRITKVTLTSGPALVVGTPSGRRRLATGHTLAIRTARPDQQPTSDQVRCQTAAATSAVPGAPALAAVDGSVATDWQPVKLPASLTVSVGGRHRVRQVVVVWGREWPPAPRPNVHPPVRPVKTLRASRYVVQASSNGRSWRTVATVTTASNGTTDSLRFAPVQARYLRIRIATATNKSTPLLQELTATG
jgi:trehalose/maltose hydrolase-like predicted phosphorylase